MNFIDCSSDQLSSEEVLADEFHLNNLESLFGCCSKLESTPKLGGINSFPKANNYKFIIKDDEIRCSSKERKMSKVLSRKPYTFKEVPNSALTLDTLRCPSEASNSEKNLKKAETLPVSNKEEDQEDENLLNIKPITKSIFWPCSLKKGQAATVDHLLTPSNVDRTTKNGQGASNIDTTCSPVRWLSHLGRPTTANLSLPASKFEGIEDPSPVDTIVDYEGLLMKNPDFQAYLLIREQQARYRPTGPSDRPKLHFAVRKAETPTSRD